MEKDAFNDYDDHILVSPYNFMGDQRKIEQEVVIYDTTLRDGEQSPGVSFTEEQKVDIAHALDEIHVHQIEAGFPAVSEQERRTVKRIANSGLDAKVLVLTRLLTKEVDMAVDCDVDMILLFFGSSDIHLKHKFRNCYDHIEECITNVVEYGKDHGLTVSFSTEDSTRTRPETLRMFNQSALEAGADRIGLTDTVGCAHPDAMVRMVKDLKTYCDKPISVHLHNDYGLAVANALESVCAGADAIATTVNGIGERAGNVPLEEFVTASKYLLHLDMGVDTTGFYKLSQKVADYSGIALQPHKPLVGKNVFSHESGIHVAAVLEHSTTYESIPPEVVGNHRRLILGKHTGKAIIEKRIKENGLELTPDQIDIILTEVKVLGEYKGSVSDEEFWTIVKMVKN